MTVKIVTDSTSDLPVEVAAQYGITVVPALVQFGYETYHDGVDLSTDDFYTKLRTASEFPTTAAPSPAAFRDVYQRLAQESDAIVSIHVSSILSATCDAARHASSDLSTPVSVIDSQSASMACGLLAILAAKSAHEGASLEEIQARIANALPRTVVYGLFNTLEYLRKGGRIGRAQAFLGSMLNIKPILAIRHGEVLPVARVRTPSGAMARLCRIVQHLSPLDELSVMYTTNPEDLEVLIQLLAAYFPPERIYRARIGPVIGSYVGPGATGVAMISKKPV